MSVRTVEVLVALMLLGIAAVVIVDSNRIGASWAADGPEAGYFPLYVGIILAIASASIVIFSLRRGKGEAFVAGEEFKRVIAVLLPAAVYVGAIYVVGVYVASALFIAFFMVWHGRFGARSTAIVTILVPLALFFLFEVWFLVPLPKGPVENLLGY